MTKNPSETRAEALLSRAMATIDGLRAQLDKRDAAERAPIAVIGLGCRFPGADGPTEFANLLAQGESVIAQVSQQRITEGSAPSGPDYTQGGFFADVADFDAAAFGLSPADALAMDPHLRLLLEVTRDAIEDTALPPETVAGSRTGVILALGAQNFDYATALMAQAKPDGPTTGRSAITGSFHSLMPGQVSYHFDLRGPSYVVDAACASGLVAVEQACQILRRGDCDRVIVAGVNLVLSDAVSRLVDQSGLWSATGACQSFGSQADGFLRGEGACVLVLARASDAQANGNPTRALILGAASGQDGHGNGIAAPNAPAQISVLQRAVSQAGISPQQVGYVEAHATGTRLGDAIEAEAAADVYGTANRSEPLVLGALKPILGHLEAASGMAALVRVILAQEAGHRPQAASPARVSDEVAMVEAAVSVDAPAAQWPISAPYAGVSAFGMSGTNAHVIVAPSSELPTSDVPLRERAPLSPNRFNRIRYWPDFMMHKEGAPAAAPLKQQLDLQGVFRRPEWGPVPKTTPASPSAIFLAGDTALSERVSHDLGALGLDPQPFEPAKPTKGQLIYCIGRGFGDLAGVQRLISTLNMGEGRLHLTVVTEEGGTNAIAAAATGLMRTITLEHPELRARLVDLPKGQRVSRQALQSALFAPFGSPILRVENDSVQTLQLAEIELAAGDFLVNPKGSHLITGGFGGIGTILCEWLADCGARHIILVGRTARPHPQAARLKALGVEITAVTADVSNHEKMAQIFREAEAQGHPVKTVFHAAGAEQNELLAQQTPEGFATAFKAKLLGASVLDALTRASKLDAFVLFSSVTVFLPLTGAGAYAAANASLGAIARARADAGHSALCVYSGTWEGSGMVSRADADLSKQWGEHGLITMPRTQALAALEAALAAAGRGEICESVMARVDWDKAEATGKAQEVKDIADATLANEMARATLDDHVCAAVAHVLGLTPDDGCIKLPFSELGVSSLAAISLRNELSIRLGLRLPATLAFNYPSVAALTDALAARLNE